MSYSLGYSQTNSECPPGNLVVSSQSLCQAAANALGYRWGGPGSSAAHPRYCWRSGNRVFFNTHNTGAPSAAAIPVCMVAPSP